MNNKQNNLYLLAKGLGVSILNIEDYHNKDSELICKCSFGHEIEHPVEYLLKTNFECLYPEISRNWFQDIFFCKKSLICGTLATMECE